MPISRAQFNEGDRQLGSFLSEFMQTNSERSYNLTELAAEVARATGLTVTEGAIKDTLLPFVATSTLQLKMIAGVDYYCATGATPPVKLGE